MKYYVIINHQPQGPYTLEELRNLYITPNTLIWREGLKDWTSAKNLLELHSVIKPLYDSKAEEKKYLNIALIVVGLLIFYWIIPDSEFNLAKEKIESSAGKFFAGTKNFKDDLSIESEYITNNLWGNKVILNIVVTNHSTYKNFKNIKIEILCYSKTGVLIKREIKILYDYFNANTTKDILVKIPRYEGAENYSVSIIDAEEN